MSDTEKNSASSSTSYDLGHVAVKAHPFYKKSPDTWFRQMESQFYLAKITSTETKFYHVLASLQKDVAECILYNAASSYKNLKKSNFKPYYYLHINNN